MIFTIGFGALILNNFVNVAGLPDTIVTFIQSLDIAPITVILLIYILLGTIIEGLAMIFLTVPIFVPVVDAMGFDLIWFGLFVLMTFEMAGTTPPFGLLLYVMLGVAPKGTTLFQVASAAFPFLVCDAILIVILIFVPGLALWLPSLM